MDFKPLTLANKELFCSYLSQTYNKLITYDFNSFYMWREWDPYLYCELAGTLIVKSDYLPPGSILFPISGSEQNILQATELII